MNKSMFGPLSAPRWRNLPIRSKLGLVFGAQLLIILTIGAAALIALINVQQQLEAVREAEELESLANELEITFVEAREIQSSFLLGWEEVGFSAAVQDAVPEHAEDLEDIRQTANDMQALLADSSLPNARRAQQNVQTLVAVADLYEQQFLTTVGVLEQLAHEETGAYVELSDRWVDLLRTGNTLVVTAGTPEDREIINAIFRIRQSEDLFRASGDPASLDSLRSEASVLRQRLDSFSVRSATGDAQAVQAALDSYLEQVDAAEQLSVELDESTASLDRLIEEAEPIWVDISTLANQDANAISAEADRIAIIARSALVMGIAVASILGVLVTSLLWRDFTDRFERLSGVAQLLEGGDLGARADLIGEDEFGQLATTFNQMARQLEGVVSGLEAQALERARGLETIADISRAITSLRGPQELLQEVVNLVRERFGFYHAQVFLLDEAGDFAILRESTGPAGEELLARGHKLAVGSQSVIGQVTASGQPVVALDTDVDPVHRRNELLPDTRSEMALPLRIGNQIIGALDVQSEEPNAFNDDDVAIFQTMADQLAVALRNAQLFEEAQAAVAEVEALNRRLVGQAWGQFVTRRGPDEARAFRTEGMELVPETDGLSPEVLERLRRESVVHLEPGENDELQVAVSIRVRGEVVGAFGFGGEELQNLDEDDLELVGAVAERVGIALENARLFEQTQQQARREQLVNEITSKIVGSTDVNDILQTTARELGRVLRAPETRIELRGEQDNE